MDIAEVIDNITEKVGFSKKQEFSELLVKCIVVIPDFGDFPDEDYETVSFSMENLFKGFSSFINDYGKDKKYETGIEALTLISEALDIEISKEEAFIYFHIRDHGKFKINEKKLHAELKSIWGQYKHYKLEDGEFSGALKSLMVNKFINYRKGSLQVKARIINRYSKD
jgi:hypothetical protein